MAKEVVDKDACVGCETCVGTCPVESISMVDGKAVVDESCIECGSCTYACPAHRHLTQSCRDGKAAVMAARRKAAAKK